MKKVVKLTDKDRRLGVTGLRYNARLAFLDNRIANAKYWNKKADLLVADLKKTDPDALVSYTSDGVRLDQIGRAHV